MPKILDEIKLTDGTLPNFAWPGGYPLYYITRNHLIVCANCANEDTSDPVIDYDINWEDEELLCEDCGKCIESAYGGD